MKTWMVCLGSVTLLYLTGPNLNVWPFAFVALSPLLVLARSRAARFKTAVYVAFFAFYFASLQGLRHAHPLMIFPLIALAAYLAVYPTLFFAMIRRWYHSVDPVDTTKQEPTALAAGTGPIPVSLIAAGLWVGGEWVRNYFATGISVLMLGHSIVGMPTPTLIQIADCFGTYGVSFLLMLANVAVADLIWSRLPHREPTTAPEIPRRWSNACSTWRTSLPIAIAALLIAHYYGLKTLDVPTEPAGTSFLLVGRDEQTEYQQDLPREQEIFSSYARQTVAAVRLSGPPIDVVVWPESMLSGGQAWYIADDDLQVPDDLQNDPQSPGMTATEMRQIIEQTRTDFTRRSADLIAAASDNDPSRAPAIIGGAGIIHYGETARAFSGVIHIAPDGTVQDTYAKNHLVMFGEYIPWIRSIPFLKNYVPPGLGLDAGSGPSVFRVGSLDVLPNLCIETAVERVSINHLRTLSQTDGQALPDVIVTLTNDAWFDHTEVVAHHLRCAQMVAIGCRRPILSAANGGPTAWIDRSGRIVELVPLDTAGEILATPPQAEGVTFYVRWGSIPAALMAIAWLAFLLSMLWQKRPFSRPASQ